MTGNTSAQSTLRGTTGTLASRLFPSEHATPTATATPTDALVLVDIAPDAEQGPATGGQVAASSTATRQGDVEMGLSGDAAGTGLKRRHVAVAEIP